MSDNKEEILLKRKKEREKKRRQQKIKKEKERKKRKKEKIIKNIIFLIIIVIVIFLPILKINETVIKDNNIYTNSDVEKELDFNNYESVFSLITKKMILQKGDFESINYTYDPFNLSMTVSIKDAKPISHDSNKNYVANNQAILTTNLEYPSPLLIGIDSNETSKINNELMNLPYNIIMQMKSIKYDDKKKDVLLIQMADGNDVYIYDNQIGDKMLYYNQMKAILDKNNKPPGNIYLYIGNYYEEK